MLKEWLLPEYMVAQHQVHGKYTTATLPNFHSILDSQDMSIHSACNDLVCPPAHEAVLKKLVYIFSVDLSCERGCSQPSPCT